MKNKLLFGSILLLLLTFVFLPYSGAENGDQILKLSDKPLNSANNIQYATGEVIVKYKENPQLADNGPIVESKKPSLDKLNKSLGIKDYEKSKYFLPGVYVLKFSKSKDVKQTVASLKKDPLVEYAEPNFVRYASFVPNDTYYSVQWGLPRIFANYAWDKEKGYTNQVTIAVVDSGVSLTHPDLVNNLVPGYDFANNDSIAQDDNGHGTHVAGIASASTNNASGVAGVSWGAKIMPVKVLNNNGSGYDSWVASGIRYAADNGAKVINLSLGGPGWTTTLNNAVQYAISKGVFIAAAAGNDGNSQINYPASYDNVVGVAATTSTDTRASFSNYNKYVDLAAPGVNIASTYWYYGQNAYAYADGTSMATPFVSGSAALILSKNPTLSPSQVYDYLKTNTRDLGTAGKDSYYGWGRININNAINATPAYQPPPPPTPVPVWSAWESLGANLSLSGPDVSSWESGRLDVFIRGTDNELWHRYFYNGWAEWEPLGGTIISDPTAVSWAPGRIDVFARGTDNALWHKFFNGGWSGWESLGGNITSAPDVASWGAGRLDVFARGTDNALWHKFFNGGWSGWESLGGGLYSDPGAVSWGPGRIDVFLKGGDNALWHKWFENGWSNWEGFGGVLTGGPDVSSWGPGRLDVFVPSTGDTIWQKTFDGSWKDFQNLGSGLTSDPGAVSWGKGRIDLFSRGADITLQHKYYN